MILVFHHIPKAGGTSVITSLKNKMRHRRIAFGQKAGAINNGFYSSHFAFKDYAGHGFYFTWVRNPVDMFYSGFRYYQRYDRPHPQYSPESTRQFIAKYIRPDVTLEQYVDLCIEENHEHMFPRGMLDLNWDRFDFVGVTERMGESLDKFGSMIGHRFNPSHVNKTATNNEYRRDDVSKMLQREIEIYQEVING